MIQEALDCEGGSLVAVARALGTTERVVRYKIRKLGIASRRAR